MNSHTQGLGTTARPHVAVTTRPAHHGAYDAKHSGPNVVNMWQRGVPVNEKLWTPSVLIMLAVGVVGLVFAAYRLTGKLGAVSGMTDVYAWGVWKTFNVMTLTALGTGGLSVGAAAWIFGRKDFHVVMRTALVMSLMFYFSGLLALGIDVGRPWNFYHVFMPWTWNVHSSLLEVAVCMPLYASVFLLFENLPMVAERLWYHGSPARRERLMRWRTPFRKVYPYIVAGAYMLPAMHQSSLGALMLLAGPKVHPLWQTPALPLLYLIQAGICGFAFVIVTLMTACLVWQRPLDTKVIGSLADWMSRTILIWIALRFVDLFVRGEMHRAFTFDRYSTLFLLENALIFVPAIVLRSQKFARTPRIVFNMAAMTCLGGMAYRFIPTTVTYDPGRQFSYFPALPELLIMLGLVALAIVGFNLAAKLFAVLPAPYDSWVEAVEWNEAQRTQAETK